MKFLIDFFPVVAFFIAFYIPEDRSQGIYLATAVAIAASFIQVTLYWLFTRRFEKMHLITLVILVVLGGATLWFQNENFIKWKPTAVNWLFAAALLGGQYLFNKNLVQHMLQHAVELPQHVWNNLNISWAIFFIFSGLANLYVAFNFSNEIWVNFKLFGILGLTLLFAIGQGFYMNQYISEEEGNE